MALDLFNSVLSDDKKVNTLLIQFTHFQYRILVTKLGLSSPRRSQFFERVKFFGIKSEGNQKSEFEKLNDKF